MTVCELLCTFRFVAISSMDIEFERIDMNQCPISEGNPAPNYFGGTARCKPSTMVTELFSFYLIISNY